MASKGGGYKGPRKWKPAATQQQRADGAGNHAAQGAGTRQAGTQSREGVPPVEDNAVFMLQAAVAAAVVMKWHNAIHLWAMQHATRSGWHKALRLTLPTGKPEALEPIVPDPTEYAEDQQPQYRADKMRYEAEIKRHLAREELIVEQGQLIVGKMLSLMTEECKSRITMRFGQLALNGDDPVELMERVEQSIAGHAAGTNASTRAYEARLQGRPRTTHWRAYVTSSMRAWQARRRARCRRANTSAGRACASTNQGATPVWQEGSMPRRC
jgi:hypothetical protein